MTDQVPRPLTCLPDWEVAELPEPHPLSWRQWTRFVGPGIVMMGIQIGGGEWLFGPAITAKYGGSLMWIASIAIILQVFYNLECGRYALYCGEPIFTGIMRTRPGPAFWISCILLLNLSALIPGLSSHGAAMTASLWLGRPPGATDAGLVSTLSFVFALLVALPILVGGKVYNMLQAVMTLKVVIVLTFCLLIGVTCVSVGNWWNIFSGFLKFGTLPTKVDDVETTVNVFQHWWQFGTWPLVTLGNIAAIGAFAGYAGGGGLSNATYSNFVRDKGWGMGSVVGAIPSAIGGRNVSLSHLGAIFPITADNLRRWKGWWRYILVDQVYVWGPGCFMGMALPALISLQYSSYMQLTEEQLKWSQSLITADGILHAPQFSATVAKVLSIITVIVGLWVMMPSQMSVVDDFSRRWTDILWSGSSWMRNSMSGNAVRKVYYLLLASFVMWTVIAAYLFKTPKLMTLVIANLNNVAIGATSFHILWINCTLLPPELRPRWYHRTALVLCGIFYLSIAGLVFTTTILEWRGYKLS